MSVIPNRRAKADFTPLLTPPQRPSLSLPLIPSVIVQDIHCEERRQKRDKRSHDTVTSPFVAVYKTNNLILFLEPFTGYFLNTDSVKETFI